MTDQRLIIWGQRRATIVDVDPVRKMVAFDISCISKMRLWLSAAALQKLNPGVEILMQNVSSVASPSTETVETPTSQEGAVLDDLAASNPRATDTMPTIETGQDDTPAPLAPMILPPEMEVHP